MGKKRHFTCGYHDYVAGNLCLHSLSISEVMVALFLDSWFVLLFDRYGRRTVALDVRGVAVTMALNVLTKSLIGIAFPIAVMLTFLVLMGQPKRSGNSAVLQFAGFSFGGSAVARFGGDPYSGGTLGATKGILVVVFVNE